MLSFEADASIAPYLDRLLAEQTAGHIAAGTLEAGFKTAGVSVIGQSGLSAWKLVLLHAGVLPWDGPRNLYRVLALPPGGLPQKGTPRTFTQGAASIFFPACQPQIATDPLWRPVQGETTAAAITSWWKTTAGEGWSRFPINAMQVVGKANAALPTGVKTSLLYIDDFVFHQADSVVRLEQVLNLSASRDQAPSCPDPDPTTPAQDYEDDLVNFNTACLTTQDGQRRFRQGFIFHPQATTATPSVISQQQIRGLAGKQSIPIVHAWRREPKDAESPPPPDNGTAAQLPVPTPAVVWSDVRDFMAAQYGLNSTPNAGIPAFVPGVDDAGPFSVALEHTYGDQLQAVDTPGRRDQHPQIDTLGVTGLAADLCRAPRRRRRHRPPTHRRRAVLHGR